ncbi:anti-anti-sigma factor [Pseudonocardia thermophila]|jgi:Anti-anti-sigma regulatory factor (antagonist of anti-sigma factor)|uniref:Anti-anti-sigma factor n=1 Tax=Pseudonocardia thermophila TaxID=1848 RepID=A0A1M6XY41_PSETH|nr:STAS domain-containing protein [Pseudonocardia thermophila]SHL10907.1 anti-anti-sigma factor [Pseudonocardia thermophila]
MSLSISTVPAGDGTATVVVDGEVDLATVGQLRAALGSAARTASGTVLDLTAASYFDSAAVKAVFEHADVLREIVVPAGGIVARVLAISGLDKHVAVRQTDG